MLTLLGSESRCCDRVRRNLLQVGFLSGLGLSCAAQGKAVAKPPARRAAIHIYLGGGPSHFETFDPKPDAPVEIRGPYHPIATNVAGIQICETLPQLARLADKYSLVRSCCHDNTGHGGGARYVTTGYKSASLEDEVPHDYPRVGSIIAKLRGAVRQGMPTYLKMGGNGRGDAAFLGPAYAPLSVYSSGKPVGLSLRPSLQLSRMNDRRALLRQLDNMKRHAEAEQEMNAMDALQDQAYALLTSDAVNKAFDIGAETETTRERYGDHNAGKSCLLARRFVEAGAGFVSIRMGSWDHHGNAGGTITSGMEANAPPFDQSVSALIEDLHGRGMSDRVLVFVWGEFGRTPRINKFVGRDHWPSAMSVLISGGGLKMGQVVGETDRRGERPANRPLSPADVLATVYRQLEIDTRHTFVNRSGRPIPVLNHGAPIEELL